MANYNIVDGVYEESVSILRINRMGDFCDYSKDYEVGDFDWCDWERGIRWEDLDEQSKLFLFYSLKNNEIVVAGALEMIGLNQSSFLLKNS